MSLSLPIEVNGSPVLFITFMEGISWCSQEFGGGALWWPQEHDDVVLLTSSGEDLQSTLGYEAAEVWDLGSCLKHV